MKAPTHYQTALICILVETLALLLIDNLDVVIAIVAIASILAIYCVEKNARKEEQEFIDKNWP